MRIRRSTNPTGQSIGDETAQIAVKERGSYDSCSILRLEGRTESLNSQRGSSVQANSNDGQM
jgi:hypothetical protein